MVELDLTTLVAVAAGGFGLVTALATLDLTLGTAIRDRRSAHRRVRTREAYTHLVGALGEGGDVAAVVAQLDGVPLDAVERALVDAARSIGGADADRLRAVAAGAGVPERARARLRSRRWPRRLRAVRILRVTSVEGPPIELLRDPVAEVRAAAVLWAGQVVRTGPGPTASWAGGRPAVDLVGALGDALLDTSALVRLAAKHTVVSATPPVAAAVDRALSRSMVRPGGTSLAAVAPLAAAASLGPVVRPDLVAPHLGHVDARVRAAAVRATAATDPARIPELCDAHIDDDPLVRAAVAEIARLHLDAVRHLVPLATDPSWPVRQAARTSLRRLGPLGRALTRRVGGEVGAAVAGPRL